MPSKLLNNPFSLGELNDHLPGLLTAAGMPVSSRFPQNMMKLEFVESTNGRTIQNYAR